MTVKTQSGSIYIFTSKGGQMYLIKGTREYLVDEITTLGLGKKMKLLVRQLNFLTYKPQKQEFIFTTPVVSINM